MRNSHPVEISGLTKSYGDVNAVDDLSLVVKTGEVHGLLGPNGAGKTTVLKCLLGITPPSSGSVLIYGSKLLNLPDPALVVGVLMENGLDNHMTVGRHLRAAAVGSGTGMQRVDDLVEECGLSGLAKRRVGKLSTGQRRRLSLATALIGDPSLLIADEPHHGLDAQGIHWLRRLLRAHADGGGAVILCSHLLTEIEQIVDQVTILNTQVRYQGSRNDFTASGASTLEDRYLEVTVGTAQPDERT